MCVCCVRVRACTYVLVCSLLDNLLVMGTAIVHVFCHHTMLQSVYDVNNSVSCSQYSQQVCMTWGASDLE